MGFWACLCQQLSKTFAGMVIGNEVTADTIFQQLLFGNLADTGDFLSGQHTYIITGSEQLTKETFHAICTSKGENIEVRKICKI